MKKIQKQEPLEQKDNIQGMNAVAGIFRSLGRALTRALPKAGLGSFPMHGKHAISALAKKKLPVKAISKYTQKLSSLAEYADYWKNSHRDSHHRHDKITKLKSRIKLIVPQVIKGSILGTVVFETYGKLLDQTNNNSLVAGAVAGIAHGVCYQIWGKCSLFAQRFIKMYRPSVTQPPTQSKAYLNPKLFFSGPFLGTLMAHAIAHSSLFSMFQVSKHFLMNSLPSIEWFRLSDQKQTSVLPSQILGIFYIALAGALAGGTSQFLSYYTEPFDRGTASQSWISWKSQLQQARNLPFPKFKQVVRPSFIPSALGFLAYQYGKLQLEDKQ